MHSGITQFTCAAFVCAAVAGSALGGTFTFTKPSAWARDAKALTFTAHPDGALELRHTSKESDWAIQGTDPIPVKAGDVVRLSCASRSLGGVDGSGEYSLSVVLYDAKGGVVSWTYGSRKTKAGEPISTELMIPHEGASICPRVVGFGSTAIAVENFKVETLGNRLPKAGVLPKELTAETDSLVVSVSREAAAITLTDKRTGRVWEPEAFNAHIVTDMWKAGRALVVKFVDPQSMKEWKAYVSPMPNKPEVLVTLESDGEMKQDLVYPPAFKTRAGDRLIVPMNEGISYPVTDDDGVPGGLPAFSGHGVCMGFFGVQDDATGAGYMGIIETTADAYVHFNRLGGKGSKTVSVGTKWTNEKKRVGYARRLRYVLFEKGGYVAMCKRYRAYAKEKGKLKTFKEKAQERPLVDRLLGAPNIWCWDWDKEGTVKQLKAAGMDRILWSGGGKPEQVAALAKMDGVLVSRYDVYRDIYHPEQLKKIGWKSGTNMDAWPEGAAWDSANSNDWRKAWPVKAKDGSWTYCACMCDAVSAKFCRKHVADELKSHPYNTRFIDVTTAAGWDTCYNPAHPMTRSESCAYRMDLLRLLGDEFGLVVGSETGHDEAVPYCDFFEGMLSLGNYRVPDSGRDLQTIWTNPPPRVVKFQVGAEYRLPLWELVYHDCLCAHWYWGDYNNKLPTLWDKRDLFNVLYGTMGMYMFNKKQWEADKDRFMKSYRMTSPVARKTGYSEMLDHQILSRDRMVQRSVFADGTVVTVNFGDKPFTLPEGDVIAGGGHIVK